MMANICRSQAEGAPNLGGGRVGVLHQMHEDLVPNGGGSRDRIVLRLT